MKLLEVQNISVFVGRTKILDAISLGVERGETVGIIGPNGSGKTTFFNCLSGFHHARRGSIQLNGTEIGEQHPFQRARLGLGRVFQNFGIFRDMTVLENILAALDGKYGLLGGFIPWSRSARARRKEALECLAEIGLANKADALASSLSGGQMRLLEIARTLAFGAELFLLDEPTAGVSPKMKDELARLIAKLQKLGKTVIVIEHDLNFIEKFCKRIVVFDGGQVVLDGPPDQIRASEELRQIYFGQS